MRPAQQQEHTPHRYVDSDGVKVDVIAVTVLRTETWVEFVREGGRCVYRMRRPRFEATFCAVGALRTSKAANESAVHAGVFASVYQLQVELQAA
jgi:hypothetical protein